MSLPVRGAWIEIYVFACSSKNAARRSPCGERGLKSDIVTLITNVGFVAPRAGSVD